MGKWLIGLLLFIASCKESHTPSSSVSIIKDSVSNEAIRTIGNLIEPRDGWMLLDTHNFFLDIKYATTNNFTEKAVYNCPACYVRDTLGILLFKINQELLNDHGYRLKIFDCYRPMKAQQKLWDIMPNPMYVTNPEKGSMHNRGMAVDVTLVDRNGKDLDMGTPYDFFGKEAHFDYPFADQMIRVNRILLRKTMEKYGLKGIRTEWWHFSLHKPYYAIEDWVWECN